MSSPNVKERPFYCLGFSKLSFSFHSISHQPGKRAKPISYFKIQNSILSSNVKKTQFTSKELKLNKKQAYRLFADKKPSLYRLPPLVTTCTIPKQETQNIYYCKLSESKSKSITKKHELPTNQAIKEKGKEKR